MRKTTLLTVLTVFISVGIAFARPAGDLRRDYKSRTIPCSQQSGFYCGDKKGNTQAVNQLQNTLRNAKVESVGGKIKLTFQGGFLFASGSSDLNAAANREINRLAGWLSDNPSKRIRVEGHTDSQGEKASNQTLSENRAKTVAKILNQKGIEKRRVKFLGYGEKKPVATNDTTQGRQANRRVEVFILN